MSGRIDDFEFSIMRNHAVVEKYYGKSTDVIIPEEFNGFSVTHIAVDCFFNSKITSVVGKSIKSVGHYAFYNCLRLTSINFPLCENVGNMAFYDCKSLTIVSLPSCKTIGSYAFEQCKSLTSVNLPVCEKVDFSAFNGCTNLTNVSLPVCEYIGEFAFKNCTKLIKSGKYKATNIDLTCRDFQYEIGKWFEEDKAVLCKKGFHYVENFYDLFNYYHGKLGKDLRIFEVDADDISDERGTDSKRVCKRIKLVGEIMSC